MKQIIKNTKDIENIVSILGNDLGGKIKTLLRLIENEY